MNPRTWLLDTDENGNCSVMKIDEDVLFKVEVLQRNRTSKIPIVGNDYICVKVIGNSGFPTSDVRFIDEFSHNAATHKVSKVSKNALVGVLNGTQKIFIEDPGPYLLTGDGRYITLDFNNTSRKRRERETTASDQALGVATVKPTKKKVRIVQTPPVIVQTPSVLRAVYGSLEHWKKLKKNYGQMFAELQRKKEKVAAFASVRTQHEVNLSSLIPSDVDNRIRIQTQIAHYGRQEDLMKIGIKTYEAKMKVKKDEMDEIEPPRAS